jgi:hypothetical protein
MPSAGASVGADDDEGTTESEVLSSPSPHLGGDRPEAPVMLHEGV